jgi:hypothetical protein
MVRAGNDRVNESNYTTSISYEVNEKKEFDFTHDPVFWLFIFPLLIFGLYSIVRISSYANE